MDQLMISAQNRTETGRKTDALRAEGKVPAVVYGFEIEPKSITLERNDFDRLYKKAGESTIIKLSIDGEEHPVLIQDIQRHPLTGFTSHIDLRRVNMDQKVEATVELKFVGEAPAVKALGGTLVENLHEVEVVALPAALVREIEIDLTQLATFDDVIRVSDITVPSGIEISNDPEQSVATVQPPRSEAEMAALDEDVQDNVDSVEVTTEKKAEEGDDGGKA